MYLYLYLKFYVPRVSMWSRESAHLRTEVNEYSVVAVFLNNINSLQLLRLPPSGFRKLYQVQLLFYAFPPYNFTILQSSLFKKNPAHLSSSYSHISENLAFLGSNLQVSSSQLYLLFDLVILGILFMHLGLAFFWTHCQLIVTLPHRFSSPGCVLHLYIPTALSA